MFDDPKKNLKRIQEELWAAEEEELPEEEIFGEDTFLFEDSQWLQETRPELEADEEPPIRNFANGYGRRQEEAPRDFRRNFYADEGMDENQAVFVEKRKKQKKEKGEKKKKKRGVGCLPVLIFLELLGIAGIAWWWYRWLT